MPDRADQPLPPTAGLPPLRDWPRLAHYSARAVVELVRARIVFSGISLPEIQARNAANQDSAIPQSAAPLLGWIAYVIPRVAYRMPFRADCLVQALAAQRWLASRGIGSAIVIGAERPADRPFGAHAWLACGSRIITGGETGQYTVLL